MVKGMTLVAPVASAAAFDALASLFAALGFEPGRGWQEAKGPGRGAAFLAPLGNLEIVTGRLPGALSPERPTPPILIEVTQLDQVRDAVEQWMLIHHRVEEAAALISPVEPTHWNSRLFTATLSPASTQPTTGKQQPATALTLGFWESENPLHNKPIAIEGDLSAAGMKFAIVVARWNAVITDRLLQGALDALHRSGAAKQDIQIVRVPGAWEIPSAARTLAGMKAGESTQYDAIITLGCLLRGETAHYEAIYTEVARGIGQSQQETGVPHAFGVLTCETLEQALDRAGLKAGNKGFEAAIAAIEMASIQRKLQASQPKLAEPAVNLQPATGN
jgi:6,7-dimethyl-8-ribityllumazine synthase